MQKTTATRVLSLLLTFLLSIGVFASALTAIGITGSVTTYAAGTNGNTGTNGGTGSGGTTVTVTSIAVTTAPTKTAYTVGESFDTTGMVVTATNSDKTTEAVTGYTYTPNGALALTDKEITITYEGKTTTQAITVTAAGGVTPVTYTVTVNTNDTAMGTATASPTPAAVGATVTLKATSKTGYTFDTWSVTSGGVALDDATKAETTFKMGTANVVVLATFKSMEDTTDDIIDQIVNGNEQEKIDAVNDLKNLLTNELGTADVEAMAEILTDGGDKANEMLDVLRDMEETLIANGVAAPTIDKALPSSEFDLSNGLFDVIGALLNAAGEGETTATLDLSKPDANTETNLKTEIPSGFIPSSAVFIDINLWVGATQLTNLTIPVTITIPIPYAFQNGRNFQIAHFGNGAPTMITPKDNGNGSCSFSVSHFSTFAFVEEVAPVYNPNTSSDGHGSSGSYGGGGGGGGGSTATAGPATTWMTSANAKSTSKYTGMFGIRASAWSRLPAGYYHDTAIGGVVQVRLYIDNPRGFTKDAFVSGYTKGTYVDNARINFERLYSNKLRVIYFDQAGAWEKPVRVAAKVDLTGMNIDNLKFYSYNRATKKLTQITTQYRVDKNGYVHFETAQGGNIIITDSTLRRK